MPEIAVIGDHVRTRHGLFRNVRNEALDAEPLLRFGLQRRVEDERLVLLLGLLDELGPPAGLVSFKQVKRTLDLLVELALILLVSRVFKKDRHSLP